jgi:hypothetical protein
VDVPTTELIYLNGMNLGAGTMNDVGMPKQGTPQTYTTLFYSHSKTASAVPNHDGFRPRVLVLNNNDIGGLIWDGDDTNLGGFTIHSFTVKEVHFE